MATWAVGDIHGCYDSLIKLLEKIEFNPSKDKLWLTGDIINRGSDSIKVLKYIYSIRDSIVMILGNHEIGLIEAYYDTGKIKSDTKEILSIDGIDEIIFWLRYQKIFYSDKKLGFCIAHAGVSPMFTLSMAKEYSKRVEKKLQSDNPKEWLFDVLKRDSSIFSLDLNELELDKYIIDSFIKMRFCDDNATFEFKEKGKPDLDSNGSLMPWFKVPKRKEIKHKIIFGHWATLGYYEDKNVCCIDSSCAWGISLSAYSLDDKKLISIACS